VKRAVSGAALLGPVLLLPGCSVVDATASVVGAAADVTGTVVGGTAEAVGDVFSGD
jgi:hypothetical protein